MATRTMRRGRGARPAVGCAAAAILIAAGSAFAGPAAPADPAGYAKADKETRLVGALESAQSEIGAAAEVRAAAIAARPSGGMAGAAIAKLGSLVAPRDLAFTGVLGAVSVAVLGGGALARRRIRSKGKSPRTVAAIAPSPRRPVEVRPPASPSPAEAGPDNVWGSILRLAAAGVSGEEIARKLGASRDDVELVIGLQRRRIEIAGAVGREAHAS